MIALMPGNHGRNFLDFVSEMAAMLRMHITRCYKLPPTRCSRFLQRVRYARTSEHRLNRQRHLHQPQGDSS